MAIERSRKPGGRPLAVYVVDAWDETTGTPIVGVFYTKAKAKVFVSNVIANRKAAGTWASEVDALYAGILRRTVR